MGVMRLGLALLLALVGVGCEPAPRTGAYACEPGLPNQCPPGWLCECRGAGCTYMCHGAVGGRCGNGALDPGEECDGEVFAAACGPGSWCHDNCLAVCAVCGNGVVEVTPAGAGEECDDGNRAAGD